MRAVYWSSVAISADTAPIRTLASMSAPVLCACMNFNWSRDKDWPVAARSIACPIAIPEVPLCEDNILNSLTTVFGESPSNLARVSKASA